MSRRTRRLLDRELSLKRLEDSKEESKSTVRRRNQKRGYDEISKATKTTKTREETKEESKVEEGKSEEDCKDDSSKVNLFKIPPTHKEPLMCCICIEEIKDIKAILDCNHSFCRDCILIWSENENTCPICKKEFSKIREKKIIKIMKVSTRNKTLTDQFNAFFQVRKVDEDDKKLVTSKTITEVKKMSPIINEFTEVSEEINVIPVEKKKQRINDNYLELDSELLRNLSEEDSEQQIINRPPQPIMNRRPQLFMNRPP